MEKDDLIKRNHDLSDDFMRYVFEHPAILEQIPQDAQVLILPMDNPELSAKNRRMATTLRARGKKVVLVTLKKSKIYPPKLELLTA